MSRRTLATTFTEMVDNLQDMTITIRDLDEDLYEDLRMSFSEFFRLPQAGRGRRQPPPGQG